MQRQPSNQTHQTLNRIHLSCLLTNVPDIVERICLQMTFPIRGHLDPVVSPAQCPRFRGLWLRFPYHFGSGRDDGVLPGAEEVVDFITAIHGRESRQDEFLIHTPNSEEHAHKREEGSFVEGPIGESIHEGVVHRRHCYTMAGIIFRLCSASSCFSQSKP